MTTKSGRFWIKQTKKKPHAGPDRAVLLCRQSITKSESISLDDQEHTNRAYAERHGYEIAEVYRSANLKGWKDDRADHDAIRELAAANAVDVVVSYDVSRTARTVRILENLAHDLEEHGVRLEFSAQEFANSTQGRQLLSLFAETETTARSIRLTDVWAYLRRQGRWNGIAPFGYRREQKTIVIDETEAPTVRQVYDWANAGRGSTWICQELYRLGTPTRNGGTWSQVHIARMLRNPAYAGGLRIDGEHVFPPEDSAWHEPMFDRADWHALQALLPDRPAVIRTKPVQSWLEGLIEHACGRRMHLIATTTPRNTLLRMFRCAQRFKPPRCSIIHAEISAKNVETAARRAIVTDLASIRSVLEIERRYVDLRKADGTIIARRRIEKARDALRTERERAEGVHLSGRRPRSWFNEKDDEIAAKLRALDAEEAELPAPIDTDALNATEQVLTVMRESVEYADDAALALYLITIRAVAVVGDGGVRIRYHPSAAAFIPSPVTVKIPRARTK